MVYLYPLGILTITQRIIMQEDMCFNSNNKIKDVKNNNNVYNNM